MDRPNKNERHIKQPLRTHGKTTTLASGRLRRVSPVSLAEQARSQIREAIFEGRIAPEERLSIERIAAELGISRTPVREALKALEADGIVQLLPNRRAMVQRFGVDEISERYAVRALLEGFCALLACSRGRLQAARELKENCSQMKEEISSKTGAEQKAITLARLNAAFHQAILRASGSSLVEKLLASVQMPTAYRVHHWRFKERQLATLEFHLAIAAAIKAGHGPKARSLMEEHILNSRDFMLSSK